MQDDDDQAIVGHVATFAGIVSDTHTETLLQWHQESFERAAAWARAMEKLVASTHDVNALDALLRQRLGSTSLPSQSAGATIDAMVLRDGNDSKSV
ncbi:hypothetical protein PINS_up002258 [Pythium insidiosum]|nr:hypothetical protein PINS_up002258 [Pythium insidiosum]